MSREQSDGEDSVVETGVDRFVETAETEVELRLPLETGMEPDQIPKDIPIPQGAVGLDVVPGELSNQSRSGLYWYTPWTNRGVCWLTGWWRLLPLLWWN